MVDDKIFYFNCGMREYDRYPVKVYPRSHWEFQAVLKGRIACLDSEPVQFREKTLWVFDRDYAHGWTGEEGEAAEILVFHMSTPDLMLREALTRAGGKLSVSLSSVDLAWLRQQESIFKKEWARPGELTRIRVSHLLTGLTVMLVQKNGHNLSESGISRDEERVEKALYWYRENIERSPSVNEVARAIGVSEVHLRRLFRKVQGVSPKKSFQSVRLDYAKGLLRDPSYTVEKVAGDLGFSDASSFSRSYRHFMGHAPRRARG